MDPNACWQRLVTAWRRRDWDGFENAALELWDHLQDTSELPTALARSDVTDVMARLVSVANRAELARARDARREDEEEIIAAWLRRQRNGWHRRVRRARPPSGRNAALKLDAYAWPGGYQMYYVTVDGGTLCPDCANCKEVKQADPDCPGDRQWDVADSEINYEDPFLYCDNCNKTIDPSYLTTEELEAIRSDPEGHGRAQESEEEG
jgi:hypothetical protein